MHQPSTLDIPKMLKLMVQDINTETRISASLYSYTPKTRHKRSIAETLIKVMKLTF